MDGGVTGIAVGMQKITMANAIQQTVTMLIINPNLPREYGACLTTSRFRKSKMSIGKP